MARRPEVDRRQADFFGAPASAPGTLKPNPEQATKRRPLSPNGKVEPDGDSIDVITVRLSPADLKEFVSALSDDALAGSVAKIGWGRVVAVSGYPAHAAAA